MMSGGRSGAVSAIRTSVAYVAALALACLGLGLGGAAVVRRARGAASIDPGACVDRTARDQIAELRRAVIERTAAAVQPAGAAGPLAIHASAPSPRQAAPPRDPGPRRYAHFEVANDAVRVTQKLDGTYDVQASDRALAGSLVRVVAVTEAGDEDELIIRVPN
jgi:hypothetical protein